MASDFEVLVECVQNAMSDDTIAFGVFRVSESKKDFPRRVVWIPTEFTCQPVMMANPLIDADNEYGDTLFTDFIMVECQISGIDFEDACLIRRKVCNAVRTAMALSSRAVDGVYATEMEGNSGVMFAGKSKIIQRFEWQINVPKPDETPVTVTQIEQTSELGETTETLIIPTPP